MPSVSGSEMKYALKKGSAWGTAVACGAGDGVLLLPTGVREGGSAVEVDDSQGLFWSQDGSPGMITVDGDLPGYLRYDGLDLLLALFMGSTSAPSLHSGGTIAYDYAMDLADNLDGIFATFGRNWKNYVEEIRSLKALSLTIRGEVGKPLQFVLGTLGDHAVRDGVNDATTWNNVTIAETSHRIQFAQGVIRMNDQSAIALASGDQIYPNSFELTATRKLTQTASGALKTSGSNPRDIIDEPVNDGMPEVSLKLGFPYHTAKTRLDALGSDTRKKMDLTFTGAAIEGGINRKFKIELPHLQYKSVDVVDEAGNIKEPVELHVHGASSAPAGMTGITKPFRISGVNQNSADPLA